MLFIHGEEDELFPIARTRAFAQQLQAIGADVRFEELSGCNHSLKPHYLLILQCISEYISNQFPRLKEPTAETKAAGGLYIYYPIPAITLVVLVALGAMLLLYRPRRMSDRAMLASPAGLVWLIAVSLILFACVLSAIKSIVPHSGINEQSIAWTRRWLLEPPIRDDFEFLTRFHLPPAVRVNDLLDYVKLTKYQSELIGQKWKLAGNGTNFFRAHVLNPAFADGSPSVEDIRGRRMLWEYFYPKVRRTHSVDEAAQIIVRTLRERMILSHTQSEDNTVMLDWKRCRTTRTGFDKLYLAAMRSVGIPTRIGEDHKQLEIWNGQEWQSAPMTILMALGGLEQ